MNKVIIGLIIVAAFVGIRFLLGLFGEDSSLGALGSQGGEVEPPNPTVEFTTPVETTAPVVVPPPVAPLYREPPRKIFDPDLIDPSLPYWAGQYWVVFEGFRGSGENYLTKAPYITTEVGNYVAGRMCSYGRVLQIDCDSRSITVQLRNGESLRIECYDDSMKRYLERSSASSSVVELPEHLEQPASLD